MNRKLKITLFVALLATIVGAGLFAADSSHKSTATKFATSPAKTLYTCGMHPWIIKDHSGNCPICGMKLEPARKQADPPAAPSQRKILYYKSTMIPGETSTKPGKDSMGMDMVPVYANSSSAVNSSEIAVDPVTIQDMDIRTTPVVSGPLRRTIRTVGYVDYDEPALADVTTKFKGWIEKLYVDYRGQLVHRGEPLFTIYSPELYSAQVEFVEALNSGGDASSPSSSATEASQLQLLQSARTKLKFFDISDAQIAALEKLRQPKKALAIDAPISGFVITKNVVEGQMVDAGMPLYRLANLDTVWVYAQIYEQDLPYVKLGQEATMTLSYLPGRTFHGRVTYIYPTVNETTRTAKVRLEFENPDYSLKPGMFANVTLTAEVAPSAVLVPDSAVLRSGEKDTVFVALPGGKFDPRTVRLGLAAEHDYDQVLSGLKDGEQVVTSGEFMLDSESQLREAIQKMTEPAQSPTMGTNMPAGMNMAK